MLHRKSMKSKDYDILLYDLFFLVSLHSLIYLSISFAYTFLADFFSCCHFQNVFIRQFSECYIRVTVLFYLEAISLDTNNSIQFEYSE